VLGGVNLELQNQNFVSVKENKEIEFNNKSKKQ
jgi:hypothetical protein